MGDHQADTGRGRVVELLSPGTGRHGSRLSEDGLERPEPAEAELCVVVFDYAADQSNQPDYNPHMVRIEKITAGPREVAAGARGTRQAGPIADAQRTNAPGATGAGRGSVKVAARASGCSAGGRGRKEAAMRLTWRDGLATLLVAAAAVLYALWTTGALMPGVSTRWMAVIAFALGVAACTANQRELGEVYWVTQEGPRPPGLYIALATTLGIVMLVAGILAFVLASEAMLATLVAAMIALWLIATGRHALTSRHPQLRAHPAAH